MSTLPPIRFGFSCYPFSRFGDVESVLKTYELLDRLGFHHTQIGEHFIVPGENAQSLDTLWYDGVSLAATALARTKRLKVLFGVVVIPYRHPVNLAKAITTLDILSKGRVIMGAGVGWTQREFELLGLEYHERGARTDDALRAVKALWASETPSYKGRYYAFDNVVFRPAPFTKPNPPIWIGGAAPQTIARAAELGDGLHPLGGPFSKLEQMARDTREALEARGRDPSQFVFSLTADFGGVVSHHAKDAGAQDFSLILGPEMGRAAEQVEQYRRAGYGYVTLRTPHKDLSAIHDVIEQFHAEVMKPLAASGAAAI